MDCIKTGTTRSLTIVAHIDAGIDASGAEKIAEALKSNTVLTSLHLGCTFLRIVLISLSFFLSFLDSG